MTPIHYTAKVLPDGHLPVPEDAAVRVGEEVSVTLAPVVHEPDEEVGRRQWANVLRDLAGSFSSGHTDISENHDAYLYPKPEGR